MNPVREFNFDRDVIPATVARARIVFRSFRNFEDKLADAISLAWEFSQRKLPGHVTPQNIAYFACLHAKCNRQFRESSRFLTGPNLRRNAKLLRAEHDQLPGSDVGTPLECILDWRREDPAELVAVKLDFDAWLLTLADRERECLEACLQGESTKDIAAQLGLSPGRISQLRRELVTYWEAFTST